ncbi:hypothetical protein [Rhizobium lentis]|uniref:Uncharacterized protein n=1 Tax=Rhizobium lentis TaxID=1138194 RepID=A0A7W8UKR1_9HYPH|nr:hypothetical protein [Rhizobium lentis]MBB4573317.1 hypothetical protein [Rhizobium lentis]MBB5549246.1 hypothetical protein [Rhizobium lentis]MBB5559780.1 hypothetical protein [Rhizobium lentis]MBB5566337.1 hypothetical protein [Rhizobium lentis]
MLRLLILQWEFPLFPALSALASHFIFVFQEFYKPGPKSAETSILCVPILAYVYANVFSILVDRTPASMLLASLATAIPSAFLAIYFIHSRQIERKSKPKISTTKMFVFALAGLALVALSAYGLAELPACTKCRRGVELIGHLEFERYYLICLFGGMIGMSSFLFLHEALRRYFKPAIK